VRYKLTLTTADGELLESWNVCMERGAEIGDEYRLSHPAAAASLVEDIRGEITRADVRAKRSGLANA
jgi:hypothetical protein